MIPSLALCRAQEAHHRAIAADALLANVRDRANAAAAAWLKEAGSAEAREERGVKMRLVAEGIIARRGAVAPSEADFSENPDRDFADGAPRVLDASH